MNTSPSQPNYTPGFDNLNDFIPSRRKSGKGWLNSLLRRFSDDKGKDAPARN